MKAEMPNHLFFRDRTIMLSIIICSKISSANRISCAKVVTSINCILVGCFNQLQTYNLLKQAVRFAWGWLMLSKRLNRAMVIALLKQWYGTQLGLLTVYAYLKSLCETVRIRTGHTSTCIRIVDAVKRQNQPFYFPSISNCRRRFAIK